MEAGEADIATDTRISVYPSAQRGRALGIITAVLRTAVVAFA